MKRKELNQEDIYNLWLEPYHGINVKWLIDNEPELIKTPEWYKKYAVTQAQHDEWYEKAIDLISKTNRCSKKFAKKNFCFDYLNLAPSIKTE